MGRGRNATHWRSKVEIERMEKLENYYAIYFLGNSMLFTNLEILDIDKLCVEHSNFIGFVKNDMPVIVSVLDEPENASKTSKSSDKFVRAILWTPQVCLLHAQFLINSNSFYRKSTSYF